MFSAVLAFFGIFLFLNLLVGMRRRSSWHTNSGGFDNNNNNNYETTTIALTVVHVLEVFRGGVLVAVHGFPVVQTVNRRHQLQEVLLRRFVPNRSETAQKKKTKIAKSGRVVKAL